MEARIIRESDMFGRVLVFWKGNLTDIPAGSKGATYYANLGADNTGLINAGATQKSGKVTAQNALILALDTDLKNIAHTASAIAQDVPGFDDLFAPPLHYNPGEVLATANAYLAQLAPVATDDAATTAAKAARVAHFTDHALPATFVTDLQAQVDAIGDVQETHEENREQGVSSTAAIARLARDGKKQVKYLDAIARNLYKNNPDKLRAWVSASHVERDPEHAATTPTPATPPAK
jgi:hypothetical protein